MHVEVKTHLEAAPPGPPQKLEGEASSRIHHHPVFSMTIVDIVVPSPEAAWLAGRANPGEGSARDRREGPFEMPCFPLRMSQRKNRHALCGSIYTSYTSYTHEPRRIGAHTAHTHNVYK